MPKEEDPLYLAGVNVHSLVPRVARPSHRQFFTPVHMQSFDGVSQVM